MIFDDEWWDEFWREWECTLAHLLEIPEHERIHKPPDKTPVPDVFVKAFEKEDKR